MKIKLNNLIRLLLNIHKSLLDLEKASYEAKNGVISNNQEYFNLVINHEDFKWLRALSEIIALIDEESERNNIDNKKIKDIVAGLSQLLTEDKDNEFSLRYLFALENNRDLFKLDEALKEAIKDILND